MVISQPMYFPWPGFFAQLAMADVLIWLDDAQFSKGSFTNRVQVLRNGKQSWMTIALEGKGSFQQIKDLKAREPNWWEPHRALLKQSLQDRVNADVALSIFDDVTSSSAKQTLSEVLVSSCEKLASTLSVLPPKILTSSKMQVGGNSSQRVLQLVKSVGGTHYLTGHGAAKYLDHLAFENQGVNVDYMDYNIHPWPQPDAPFIPYVTTLDLVASTPLMVAKQNLNPCVKPWRDFIS